MNKYLFLRSFNSPSAVGVYIDYEIKTIIIITFFCNNVEAHDHVIVKNILPIPKTT